MRLRGFGFPHQDSSAHLGGEDGEMARLEKCAVCGRLTRYSEGGVYKCKGRHDAEPKQARVARRVVASEPVKVEAEPSTKAPVRKRRP